VAGRLAARPAELEVGIVTAVLGAPAFIWLVRRPKLAEL
jgi:iron complex transport system permease protein